MVTVTDGVREIVVTSGTAKQLESLGFVRVVDNQEDVLNTKHVQEEVHEDLTEKPISEWTKEELQRFAKDNGIDITGAKPKEVRERIKDFLG